MPEDETGVKKEGVTLLRKAGEALVPIFVTAGSLLGFVAFAGAVIVWTRFFALEVPPDQAVKAVPRSELVATGSSVLLLFGFFGALAVLATYLVDRSGRATQGMQRMLLALATVESGIAIALVPGGWSVGKVHATVALVVLAGVALALTFARGLIEFKDIHDPRPREKLKPELDPSLLRDDSGKWRASVWILWAIVALVCLVAGLVTVLFVVDLSVFLTGVVFVVIVAAGLAIGLYVCCAACEICYSKAVEKYGKEKAKAEGWKPPGDRWERRPTRPVFHLEGVLLTALVGAVAIFLSVVFTGRLWLAVPLGSAAVLSFGLWRIADLSKEGFMWFGLAVFLSVPLFGTLAMMARNLADPQVQPMALIRKTDGPNEAIQGLYVTEANKRVYFATVATEGCSSDLTPGSGRLEWVPTSEVVAMSVGPLQSVEDAGARALEMAYSLTPAIETGSGVEPSLGIGQEKAPKGESQVLASPLLDKRLAHTGPAVRPNFGAGLSLTPADASPEEDVTLRMSAPNKNDDVQGFGRTRSGRALRVGGVRANIAKEPARTAEGAEFMRTDRGQLLLLAKGEPYVETSKGTYVSVPGSGEELKGPRFLKLIDRRVLEVEGESVGRGGFYLELKSAQGPVPGPPQLAEEGQEVMLKAADTDGVLRKPQRAYLDPSPLGQAWHEREITFEVPKSASTGAVTVECSQLAGEPLLQVTHAPEARISVRMHPGSDRVSFNSRRSTDDDEEEMSRRWDIGGLRRGHLPGMSVDLPPRLGAYVVKLTVTDESGRSGSTEIRLLRTPASLFPFDKSELSDPGPIERTHHTLMHLLAKELPAAIEIDGHADDPGTPRENARLSLERAEYVRQMLRPTGPIAGVGPKAEIPVKTLAYGEDCPVDPRPGRRPRNRRVDVFVLDPGVSIAPPAGCHVRHFESDDWHLRTCTGDPPQEGEPKPGGGFLADFRKLVTGLLLGTPAEPPGRTCSG
ncbi:MAG TPA: OmpA family protein [Solirubrobacterales bacterium]|nr:OmpA family protein [Solirubrobacterales bacterium]